MSPSSPVVLALSNTVIPAIAIEILPHGLAVNRIYLNTDGETHDIVQGPFNEELHPTETKYLNTIIGRYVNRVPVKPEGHVVEKNGYHATVHPVSNESPTVSLHGGPKAFDTVLFEQITPADSTLFSKPEIASLQKTESSAAIFTGTLADGDLGYPGTVRVEVLFALINPGTEKTATFDHIDAGQILIVYRAKLLEPNKVTPINLTQHWGFNLDASLRPEPHLNIRDHFATVKAPAIVDIDEVALPTGKLIATKGTPHDHNAKKIGDGFPENGGYDHYYLFSEERYKASTATQKARPPLETFDSLDLLTELLSTKPDPDPAVELWSDKSGFKIQFSTNQSGVQFYTANFQDGTGTRKKIHGGSEKGPGYPKEGAVYLEFHDPLSAFLYPHNGADTLLTSDELYHNYVKLNISFKPPPSQ